MCVHNEEIPLPRVVHGIQILSQNSRQGFARSALRWDMSRVVSPRLGFLAFTLAGLLGMAIFVKSPSSSNSWLLTYLATGLVAGSPFGIRAAIGFALGFTAQL